MHEVEREIVVLKPTPVFLSFLEAQRPDLDLPSLSALRADMTAYSIPRHETDEILLDEIERNYVLMFRHEITRILGEINAQDIQGSFLDFLCCFKFELHAQVVVMESTLEAGQQVLCVKPKSVLLNWIKSKTEEKQTSVDVLERVNLSHLTENATVIVKNFNSTDEVGSFLRQYHRPIFKAEMFRLCDISTDWPSINAFEDFDQYFDVDFHRELIHLN